jgi:hypothetical protein
MFLDCASQIELGMAGTSFISAEDRVEYRRMQEAVPSGERILARLETPYLLDFARNTVYIVDQPGPGLPPGFPSFQGSEALADYLMSHSIRYVSYSYGAEAEFLRELRWVFAPGQPPQMADAARQTQDFLSDLQELAKTRKRIYDDGKNFVLDLRQRNR